LSYYNNLICFYIKNQQYQRVIGGVLFAPIPCSTWYCGGWLIARAYISITWKVGVKEKLGGVLLENGV